MKIEVWKAVLGYEGLYEISNYGNVKALNYKCLGIVKIIRQSTSCYGYKVVGLSKNGKTKQFFVHRLVAIAFVPNPNGYPIVNHKDENKTNNNEDNLEWCTNKYNLNYGSAREKMVRGKRKSVLQYDINCNLIKVFRSISEAARETGLCRAHISACYRGENRTHGGFFWRPDGYPPKPGDEVQNKRNHGRFSFVKDSSPKLF